MMNEKYFSVGDATYSYEISGQGPPVVLLHGFTGSTSTWSTFIATYLASFQLITIDLPGHGKTFTKTSRSMEMFCQDLIKIFLHLKLTKVHLVGYSMGGRAALSLAMLYPEWIESLTLESSSPGLRLNEERSQRKKNDESIAWKIENEGINSFVAFWEGIPLFSTQKKLPVQIQQTIRKERLTQTEKGLAHSLRSMGTGSQPSWWGRLNNLGSPVLLIVGEADKKFLEINKQMNFHFPFAQLVIVKNAGHAIHVEQPDKFGKIVTEFINSINIH